MKKLLSFAVTFSLILSLCSCNEKSDSDKDRKDDNQEQENNAPEIFGDRRVDNQWSLDLYEAGRENIPLDSDQQARLTEIYSAIAAGGSYAAPMSDGDCVYTVYGDTFSVTKHMTDYEYYLSADTLDGRLMFFDVSGELDDLAAEIAGAETAADSTAENGYLGITFACEEPDTDEEYISAAKNSAALWLDTLAGTGGAYGFKSYSYADLNLEEFGREMLENGDITQEEYEQYLGFETHNFITAGTVGGVKEFVVQINFHIEFDEQGDYPNNIWKTDRYYDGIFSAFYARCYWKDGEAGIREITDNRNKAIGPIGPQGAIPNGTGYETFYDFMNDGANEGKYTLSLPEMFNPDGSDELVSHNPVMISDGRVVTIEIYIYKNLNADGSDKVYGEANRTIFFADGEPIYCSPVVYNQQKAKPLELEFTRGFKLLFDDYNGDGNPDSLIKVDGGDEHGSYYKFIALDHDGTLEHEMFFTDKIYMAGCFDDSIRLQKVGPDKYVTWAADENSADAYPDTELDDYRMYSQKYYSPAHLKLYSPDTENVICYFWNNTAAPVTSGTTYDIEKYSDGVWTVVSAGNTVAPQTVTPRDFAELNFAVSELTDNGEYRIALHIGDAKVYGGFYYGTEIPSAATVRADESVLDSERTRLAFTLENTGLTDITPTAVLEKDGEKITDVPIKTRSRNNTLEAGGVADITAFPPVRNGLFSAGEYTLTVSYGAGNICSAGVTLVPADEDARYGFVFDGFAANDYDGGFSFRLSLKNTHRSKEKTSLSLNDTVWVLKDGKWAESDFANVDVPPALNGDGKFPEYSAEYGETVSVRFTDMREYYLNSDGFRQSFENMKARAEEIQSIFEEVQQEGQIDEEGEKALEYYERFKGMTYEEYVDEMISQMAGGMQTETVNSGDFCRVSVESGFGSQYVYFTAP